jgi:Flp pilus assembly pilin Flp
MPHWKKLWRSEEGQDLTEYTLLVAFIATVLIGVCVSGPMSSVSKIWVQGNSELSTAVVTAAS